MLRTTLFAAALALSAGCATAQPAEPAVSPITAAINAAPPAEPPLPHAGEPATIFAWDEMHFTDTDVGRRIQLMDEASRTLDQLEIHITPLNPGQSSHDPHRHSNEEVIVLHQGTLRVYVNGETKLIGPGSLMVFLSNDWHSVNNVGDVPATYHVINFRPSPAE
jgi:quercetin dioxygenase-like cupin family protein